MSHAKWLWILFCVLPIWVTQALAGSGNNTQPTGELFKSLSLTIYQNGALFYHKKDFSLKKGQNMLKFSGICPELLPGSIFVEAGNSSKIVSYSYELKPVSTRALLRAFQGKTVFLKAKEKCCVQKAKREAKLVSFSGNKALVQTQTGLFETDISRIVFPAIPKGFSNKPQLSIGLWSFTAAKKPLGILYLSGRLNWKGEYTGMLSTDEKHIDVQAFSYIKNNSDMLIQNAKVKLVAGEVNLHTRRNFPVARAFEAKAMAAPAAPIGPEREEFFEYHIYKYPGRLSLFPRQTKHVLLFQADALPCNKKFVLRPTSSYYYRNADRSLKNLHPDIILEIKTEKGEKGPPFPAGIFRVYKRDSENSPVFVGEQRISSTASGEKIVLNLGRAFDITAKKKQLAFKRIRTGDKYSYRYDSKFEIVIHNSKDIPVSITIKESIPGDWNITKENFPHERETAHLVSWKVKVPPRGKEVLRYSVRVWD